MRKFKKFVVEMLSSFAALYKPVLMKYEVYSGIVASEDFSQFDFISLGKKGAIRKRVTFTMTEIENVYNLVLGDVGEDGEIDDLTVSDNGDRNKVLATVEDIATSYTTRYPNRWILFQGSTESRTRLYRMAIGLHLEELSVKFEICTFVGEELVPFCKNMKVNGFVIKGKN
ncbi:MAG TPA: hypothetical protein VHC48_01595, partial [Puia sp.]|nr:hypothetical protein [Puia sp.]